jgi:hypothetical protein
MVDVQALQLALHKLPPVLRAYTHTHTHRFVGGSIEENNASHVLLVRISVFVHVLADHQAPVRVIVQMRLVEREETVVKASVHVLSVEQIVQEPAVDNAMVRNQSRH